MPNKLDRLLNPRSVALVGASERQSRSNLLIAAISTTDVELILVNPNHSEQYGKRTYASLREVTTNVDVVISLVNARASVDVVADAVAINAGGIIVIAAGFSENGSEGTALQNRLVELSKGTLPVLGPNCLGFINVHQNIQLIPSPPKAIRLGGIAVVSQSGALIGPILAAGADRLAGFSYLISAGNQAVTDITDFVNYLIDDCNTQVICLVIEGVPRPAEFLLAADRARQAGKPIVALLLGRSERARQVANSHTGTIVGDADAMEIALRQIGIAIARDVDELLDRALLFEQIPNDKWISSGNVAFLTASGGSAGLASDIAVVEGLDLPELANLVPALAELIPGTNVANPLDLTGFALNRPDVTTKVLQVFHGADNIEAVVMMISRFGEEDEQFGNAYIDPFISAAASSDRAHVVASPVAIAPPTWAEKFREANIAIGHGLRGTIRGLATMRSFGLIRGRDAWHLDFGETIERPSSEETVFSDHQTFLSFKASMELLVRYEIPIAPYRLIAHDALIDLSDAGFDAPYVVKLADVPHRTEHQAVQLGIDTNELSGSVEFLRSLAKSQRVSRTVVVQPRIDAQGELIVGVKSVPQLGALVVMGLGGINADLSRSHVARLAPLRREDVLDMIAELGISPWFSGFRGKAPWNADALTKAVCSVSNFAHASHDWLESMDLNPLIWNGESFFAVDALLVLSAQSNQGTGKS